MTRFLFKAGSERNPLRLAYEQLDRSQWLSPDQLREYQLRRLRALVAHCKTHVPYYRAALAGLDPQALTGVEQLPILTRRRYQEDFARMRAEALPAGQRAAGEAHTSGTTGVPVEVLQTDATQNVWLALFLRDLDWAGVDLTGRLAAIRALPPHAEGRLLPYWHPRWADLLPSGTSIGYDIHHDPRDLLAWLMRVRPNYVLNHPAAMEAIARLAPGPWPEFKGYLSFAETLHPHQRETIQRVFGVPIYDTYSSCEAGYIASRCPSGEGLHVHAESVIVEVLDEGDRPCPPGVTGRAVLTVLHNYRGPFLRYDIGDEVTPGHPCRCGRGLPLLAEVQGKVRPHLRLPDGELKCSTAIATKFRLLPGIHQYQVVQRADDSIVIRVVPSREWSDTTPDGVRQLVYTFMGREVPVEVLRLEAIPLPPGGKLRSIVVEPPLY